MYFFLALLAFMVEVLLLPPHLRGCPFYWLQAHKMNYYNCLYYAGLRHPYFLLCQSGVATCIWVLDVPICFPPHHVHFVPITGSQAGKNCETTKCAVREPPFLHDLLVAPLPQLHHPLRPTVSMWLC